MAGDVRQELKHNNTRLIITFAIKGYMAGDVRQELKPKKIILVGDNLNTATWPGMSVRN